MTSYKANFRTLKDAEKYVKDMRKVRGNGNVSDPVRKIDGGYVVIISYGV